MILSCSQETGKTVVMKCQQKYWQIRAEQVNQQDIVSILACTNASKIRVFLSPAFGRTKGKILLINKMLFERLIKKLFEYI